MVRPKKSLGQHFLRDKNIAEKIADSLTGYGEYRKILEIGPGMGVLTEFLLEKEFEVWCIEVDDESVGYLQKHFPQLENRLLHQDFLQLDLARRFGEPVAVTGNFPYFISTQILFRTWEQHHIVPEFTGMFQREVAKRIAAGPGSKQYGILSVLLQAYYEVEYLFTVPPGVFSPPPRVHSGVIRMQHLKEPRYNGNPSRLKQVVKTGFNQRRKTLRNALKKLPIEIREADEHLLTKRAEQLTVEEFGRLADGLRIED